MSVSEDFVSLFQRLWKTRFWKFIYLL